MNLTVILGANGAGRRHRRLLVGPHGPAIGGPRQPLRRLPGPQRPQVGLHPCASWARPLAGSCPIRSWTGWKSSWCRPGTRTGSTCPASSGSRSPWPSWRLPAAPRRAAAARPDRRRAAVLPARLLGDEQARQAPGRMQAKAADIIDQLTICVEAGLGFDAALARVATTTEGPLTDELRTRSATSRPACPRPGAADAGRPGADPEIRQLVTALLQAQKHGVPMAETLRIQSAEMRLKRKQRTEEKAAKLTRPPPPPPKMLLPPPPRAPPPPQRPPPRCPMGRRTASPLAQSHH